MKVKEFIGLLDSNRGKEMKVAYLENQYVDTNYHLTEVKNVTFETTDCGGKTNDWTETHMQLWESPEEKGKSNYMTTDKILAIIQRVDGIRPLFGETELKFEYGNQHFNTGVMPVKDVRISENYLEVLLFEEKARCKANELCGVEIDKVEAEEPCCSSSACC